MANVRCLGIVLPAGNGFRWARRLTAPSLWALGLAFALLLVGLAAASFAEVKGVPQSDVAAAQLELPGDAQNESRLTPCPLCGRVVCPCLCDDLQGTLASDGAVLSVSPAAPPVLAVARLPWRYAPSALAPPSRTSFEPRGPPRSA